MKKTKVTYSNRICMSIEFFLFVIFVLLSDVFAHWVSVGEAARALTLRCGEGWPGARANLKQTRSAPHSSHSEDGACWTLSLTRGKTKKDTQKKTFKISKWDGRVTKEVNTEPVRIKKNDGFLVLPRCADNGSWFLRFLRKEFDLFLLKRTSSWDVRLDIRIINGFIPNFTFR